MFEIKYLVKNLLSNAVQIHMQYWEMTYQELALSRLGNQRSNGLGAPYLRALWAGTAGSARPSGAAGG